MEAFKGIRCVLIASLVLVSGRICMGDFTTTPASTPCIAPDAGVIIGSNQEQPYSGGRCPIGNKTLVQVLVQACQTFHCPSGQTCTCTSGNAQSSHTDGSTPLLCLVTFSVNEDYLHTCCEGYQEDLASHACVLITTTTTTTTTTSTSTSTATPSRPTSTKLPSTVRLPPSTLTSTSTKLPSTVRLPPSTLTTTSTNLPSTVRLPPSTLTTTSSTESISTSTSTLPSTTSSTASPVMKPTASTSTPNVPTTSTSTFSTTPIPVEPILGLLQSFPFQYIIAIVVGGAGLLLLLLLLLILCCCCRRRKKNEPEMEKKPPVVFVVAIPEPEKKAMDDDEVVIPYKKVDPDYDDLDAIKFGSGGGEKLGGSKDVVVDLMGRTENVYSDEPSRVKPTVSCKPSTGSWKKRNGDDGIYEEIKDGGKEAAGPTSTNT